MTREEIDRVKTELEPNEHVGISDKLDCIDRTELLEAIDTWDKFGFDHTGCFVREPKDDFITYIHYDDVIKCIKGIPSVRPLEQTGHWIEYNKVIAPEPFNSWKQAWKCSECGYGGQDDDNDGWLEWDYCPNCGAKMESEG